jgi:hypothetical protein
MPEDSMHASQTGVCVAESCSGAHLLGGGDELRLQRLHARVVLAAGTRSRLLQAGALAHVLLLRRLQLP